jgi:formate/nitrite transporter
MSEIRIDALLPGEMATRAEYLGVRKAEMPFLTMFTLAVMAGAFISLGAIFATTIAAGGMTVAAADGTTSFTTALPFGVGKLLTGMVFSLGLILVVVGGAELFTGNNLIVMAWASGKVTGRAVLRNWAIVYLGNFIGSIGTALLMLVSRQYTFGSNSVGIAALKIGVGKVEFEFWQALALGILCNALVCLAVWLTYSARSTVDKIVAIIFPVTAFVAAGFEHSIANMYFIPYAILIKMFDPGFVAGVADKIPGIENLTWGAFFLNNLIPVTIGNIIGGTVLVAASYWSVFLRNKDK